MMTMSREKLYHEIWKISARRVAEKYNLDYPKLLNVCKENDIPIPGSKYWVTLRTGQDVSQLIVPLTESENSEVTIPFKKNKSKVKKNNHNQKLHEVNVPFKEECTELPIDIEKNIIEQKLSMIEKGKIEKIISTISSYKIYENKKLHKKISNYKKQVALWNTKVKNSKRDYFDPRYERNDMQQPKFIGEVSKESLPRLYKILDMLVEIFEKIGETVTDDFCVLIGDDIVPFEIIESTDKIKHELTKEEAKRLIEYEDSKKHDRYASKPNIRKYDYVYNGKFRIKMSTGAYIKDKKEQVLEEMLPEILIIFYESYVFIKSRREELEEQQRQREEQQRIQEEYKNRVKNEKKKTIQLLNTMEDYRLAEEIRVFANVLAKNGKIGNEYVKWVLDKADWIDPTVSTDDELLGKREHHKDSEAKMNFLKDKYSGYLGSWWT